MRKLFAIATLIAGTLVMVSCGDDDSGGTVTISAPSVTAGAVADVANGGTGTVSFTIALDENLTTDATWALSVTGDVTATIGGETEGSVGSATVTADVTAGTTAGGASVRLVVTNPAEDPEGQTGEATAVFDVLEAGDNPVTLTATVLNTDDDPPSAVSVLINEGDGISLPGTAEAINSDFESTFEIAAADGIGAFTVAINGGTPVDLLVNGVTDGSGAAIASGATAVTGLVIPGSVISSAYTAGITNTFVFTVSDADGDDATATISVDITEGVASYSSTETTDQQGNDARNVVGEIAAGETITWDVDSVYIITGRLIVSGTLNIPAGTVIKGATGSGVNAKAMIVAVGGTLNATGTRALPIIMTSINDAISPSDVASGDYVGSLAPDLNGLWGGLIVLGDAPISASATSVQIEGIPTSVEQGLYGGSTDADNSGTITYLSLRHGGSNIGAGNEINGITLGGVGSGTTINHVEVVANQDDGIEWFGGSVDVTNAVIWNSGDDSMDSDQNWTGSMTNFIIVTPDGSAFELDGPEGAAAAADEFHTFSNGTVYAGNRISNLVDWDDNTNAGLDNIYFFGIEEDYYTGGNGIASFGGDGKGATDSWEITLPGDDTEEQILGTGAAAITNTVTENNNTVGISDASEFDWTFAYQDVNGLGAIGLIPVL